MSKDNTCPNCDGSGVQPGDMYSKCVTWCVTCHGSGQQEDNTGHPTAETPEDKSFENVSESSRTPELKDIKDMPNHNPKTASRGETSVSDGQAYWHPVNRVACKTHGAMLAVNEQRSIWRCEACGAGAVMYEQLRDAIEGTADYLYSFDGDPRFRQPIDTLRQLINEEFVARRKVISSQLIMDILRPIEALLATEYDRGKVDGAVEELGLLAKETGPGKPGETWEQWAYRVSDYLKDRLAELKSKGRE